MKRYIVVVALSIITITASLIYYFSPTQIKQRIMDQYRYSINFVDELTVQFDFNDKWLKLNEGKNEEINELIYHKYDTKIWIDSIEKQKERNSLNITLKIQPDYRYHSGEFISIYRHNPNGTSSSLGLPWKFFSNEGNELNLFDKGIITGTGSGSYDRSQYLIIGFDTNKVDLYTHFSVETPPMYIYQYQKNRLF